MILFPGERSAMSEVIIIILFTGILAAGGWIVRRIDSFIDHHVVKYDKMEEEENSEQSENAGSQ